MTASSTPAPADRAAAEPLPPPPRSSVRRSSAWLHSRRRLQLGLLLSTPLGWLVIAYLGSLFILLLNAFWAKDAFTGKVIPFAWSLDAFVTLFTQEVYRTVALRTLGMAVLVTITDALLAFPIAYYMARIASPRKRGLLTIAVLMPLWAAYLVKVYAWRTILQGGGLAAAIAVPLGLPAPKLDNIVSENVNTDPATTAGIDNGRITRRNVVQERPPRSADASSSEPGIRSRPA